MTITSLFNNLPEILKYKGSQYRREGVHLVKIYCLCLLPLFLRHRVCPFFSWSITKQQLKGVFIASNVCWDTLDSPF